MEVYPKRVQQIRGNHPGLIPISEKLTKKQQRSMNTVKILKIGTPEIITIIVPQLEQMNFTVQYCVQKMQTE